MRKYIYIVLAIGSLMLTGCYDELAENINKEIQTLKEVNIASKQAQVDSIKHSISNIETLTKELDGYMDALEDVSASLAVEYETLTTAIETIKTELQGKMNDAAEEMLREYESAKSALEGKINEIDAIRKALKESKESLNERIDSLGANIDEEYAAKSWVEATFATLDSQKAVSEDVFSIKAYIEELEKSIEATRRAILDSLERNLSEIGAIADEKLVATFEKLYDDYKSAVDAATEEVQKAFSDSLSTAITNSTESLKGWVDTLLTGYIIIEDALGKINAIHTLIGSNPGDKVDESYKSVQTKIVELQTSLNSTMEDLEKAYKRAIEDAITQSGKDMDAEIARQIAEITGKINEQGEEVKKLETEAINLRTKVTELQNRINTVDEQITKINVTLKVLDSLKMTLDEYVDSIKLVIENNHSDNYNETKALIDALQAASDAIKSKIDSLNGVIGTLPTDTTDVTGWVRITKENIDAQFALYCLTDTITAYNIRVETTLRDQGDSISTYKSRLGELIDNARETIEGWLNDSLKVFHTKGRIDTLILNEENKLKSSIAGQDSTINASFDSLKNAFNKAVADFVVEYKDAVEKAIVGNQGKVDTAFYDAIEKASSKITALNTRITAMDKDIDSLMLDIEAIRKAVDTLAQDISDIYAFIDTTGFNSLQDIVDYVDSVLATCPDRFARIGQLDTLKMVIYGEEGKDSTGLKFWVDQIKDLTARLETAETQSDSLAKFFAGFSPDSTLTQELSVIYGLLDELKKEVDGSATKDSLQTMINKILTALYGGADKSEDTAIEGSIRYRLDALIQNTLAATFHSISYIPRRADSSVDAGEVTLEFFIDPAELATLINGKTDWCYLTNGKETVGTITSVEGSSGVLTVKATDVAAGWVALCVEVTNTVEEAEGTNLEFISQYIRVK